MLIDIDDYTALGGLYSRRYYYCMLICLGGFVGSGRRILAEKIAEQLKFHYYNTQEKVIRHTVRPGEKNVSANPYFISDQDKTFLYKRVLADLPLLSKMHSGIVVDDEFNRAGPRNQFFSEVKKYIHTVAFVWIDCDDEYVENNLRIMTLRKRIPSIQQGLRKRALEQKEFEPFATPQRTFRPQLANDKAAALLIELIRKEMPGMPMSKFRAAADQI